MQVDDALTQSRLLRHRSDGRFRKAPVRDTADRSFNELLTTLFGRRRSPDLAARTPRFLSGLPQNLPLSPAPSNRATDAILTSCPDNAMNEWLFSGDGRRPC